MQISDRIQLSLTESHMSFWKLLLVGLILQNTHLIGRFFSIIFWFLILLLVSLMGAERNLNSDLETSESSGAYDLGRPAHILSRN